jgi:hypothetical protein
MLVERSTVGAFQEGDRYKNSYERHERTASGTMRVPASPYHQKKREVCLREEEAF